MASFAAYLIRQRAASGIVLILALYCGTSARADLILTSNLLANPGAETGDTSGWTVSGEASPYAASVATIPPEHDNGFPPHSGVYYFVGGRDFSGTLEQTVSLLPQPGLTAALIDSGTLSALAELWELSLNQGDNTDVAMLAVTFRDGGGVTLNQFVSPELAQPSPSHPVNAQYGNFAYNLAVPSGTRFIDYRLEFLLRSGTGSDVDVFIDDTSLLITAPSAVPEPGSLTLAGLGIVGFLAARRRKPRHTV